MLSDFFSDPLSSVPSVREVILHRHVIAGAILGSLALMILAVLRLTRSPRLRSALTTSVIVLITLSVTDLSTAAVLVLLADKASPFLGFSKIVAGITGCILGIALTYIFLPSQNLIEMLSARIKAGHDELLQAISERERVRSESLATLDAYAEKLRRLASVVETSPDPIIGLNVDGTVWQWGRAAEDLFGLREDEVLGERADVHPGSCLDLLWKEVERLGRDAPGSAQSELELSLGGGEKRVVWLTLVRLPATGRAHGGWSVNLRDITEKRRAERAIAESLREKEALLKEVHHRVKNNLQLICSLLRLQSKEVRDTDSLGMFRRSEDRIRSLALVHEKLYRAEALASIPFGDYVNDLTGQLARALDVEGRVTLEREIDKVMLPVDVAISAGLIVNELFSFSVQHALNSSREPRSVRVNLRVVHDTMAITISDTGTSMDNPAVVADPKSLGCKLVKSLSGQLHGELRWEHNGEARFVLTIPVGAFQESPAGVAAAA